MKKAYTMLALFLIITLLLCSCGSSGSAAFGAPQGESTAQPASADTGTVSSASSGSVSWEIGEPFIHCVDMFSTTQCGVRFSVPVTNTGKENLFLRNASFDFLDAQGNNVGKAEYIKCSPDILAPGETGWYCDLGMAEVPLGEAVKIEPHIDPQKSPYRLIRLSVTDITYNEENMPDHGMVLNDSEFSLPNTIFGTALFFDAQGTAFFRVDGVTARLEPGESKSVSFGGLILTDDLRPYYDHFEIIAYPDASSNAIRVD